MRVHDKDGVYIKGEFISGIQIQNKIDSLLKELQSISFFDEEKRFRKQRLWKEMKQLNECNGGVFN